MGKCVITKIQDPNPNTSNKQSCMDYLLANIWCFRHKSQLWKEKCEYKSTHINKLVKNLLMPRTGYGPGGKPMCFHLWGHEIKPEPQRSHWAGHLQVLYLLYVIYRLLRMTLICPVNFRGIKRVYKDFSDYLNFFCWCPSVFSPCARGWLIHFELA